MNKFLLVPSLGTFEPCVTPGPHLYTSGGSDELSRVHGILRNASWRLFLGGRERHCRDRATRAARASFLSLSLSLRLFDVLNLIWFNST